MGGGADTYWYFHIISDGQSTVCVSVEGGQCRPWRTHNMNRDEGRQVNSGCENPFIPFFPIFLFSFPFTSFTFPPYFFFYFPSLPFLTDSFPFSSGLWKVKTEGGKEGLKNRKG